MKRITISLRVALIGINLLILILPIAGVQLMRLYESALVRQTESALIAQGAFVAAFYRSMIDRQGTQNFQALSKALNTTASPPQNGSWLPRPPTLDLATSRVLAPFPDAIALPTSASSQGQRSEAKRLGALLNPTLKDAQLTTLAGIRVVDIAGTIIASTGNDIGFYIGHADEIESALKGASVSTIRNKADTQDNTPLDSLSRTSHLRVFVSLPIIMHERLVGAVLLSRTPPSIVQALYGKRHLLLAATGLLLLLVITMSIVIHRLITRPMSRLVKYAEQMSQQDASAAQRLANTREPRLRELARLQRSIVEMAGQLTSRADYLQGFARHVSHEFKTPLTSIRGAIELLEDHRNSMTNEQFERFVENIRTDTTRLTALTDRLNDLTRAEMQSVDLQATPLRPLLEELSTGFPNLTFDTTALGDAVAHTDPSILATVLETLIDNAAQHEARTVTCSWERGILAVENDGRPISSGNQEQIFTPFFTTRREQGGAGLGLTIATTMIERMGGRLSLDPTSIHPRFLIDLNSPA